MDISFDQYCIEVLFETNDFGVTWDLVNVIPIAGSMYPSVLPLNDNKYLITFTKRVVSHGLHMGVYAFILEEKQDGEIVLDVERDLFVIDEKSPDYAGCGNGFGNTIRIDNEKLMSVYSYMSLDEDIDLLLKERRYNEREVYEFFYKRCLGYFYEWTAKNPYEKFRKMNQHMKNYTFTNLARTLNTAGYITETVIWNIEA